MLVLKIYACIAVLIYFVLGLYLIKKGYMQPLVLIALIIFSVFWLPFIVYSFLGGDK